MNYRLPLYSCEYGTSHRSRYCSDHLLSCIDTLYFRLHFRENLHPFPDYPSDYFRELKLKYFTLSPLRPKRLSHTSQGVLFEFRCFYYNQNKLSLSYLRHYYNSIHLTKILNHLIIFHNPDLFKHFWTRYLDIEYQSFFNRDSYVTYQIK